MEITKGDWKANIRVYGVEGSAIVEATQSNYTKVVAVINNHKGEQKANAHLIAAAPRMCEALKEARLTLNVLQPEGSAVLREIDQALAKAEEKQ